MQTIEAGELKRGQVLMLDGVPHVVEEFHAVGTAKTKRKIHTRLRNLLKGLHAERAFSEDDRLPVAELEQRSVQFSYRDGERFVFLDTESYEELSLSTGQIGERKWFLKENEEYKALFLEGKLLEVVLPDTIPMKVETTAAPQRGGSDAAWKPATLEGGLEIMVPLFIAPGEVVRVDTQTKKYVRKETAE
ncbi:MAG: elongation factor P [Verrucomicrobiae bacterium]|nr:elongation factor P [Verrucomicrobiae bacterium]